MSTYHVHRTWIVPGSHKLTTVSRILAVRVHSVGLCFAWLSGVLWQLTIAWPLF